MLCYAALLCWNNINLKLGESSIMSLTRDQGAAIAAHLTKKEVAAARLTNKFFHSVFTKFNWEKLCTAVFGDVLNNLEYYASRNYEKKIRVDGIPDDPLERSGHYAVYFFKLQEAALDGMSDINKKIFTHVMLRQYGRAQALMRNNIDVLKVKDNIGQNILDIASRHSNGQQFLDYVYSTHLAFKHSFDHLSKLYWKAATNQQIMLSEFDVFYCRSSPPLNSPLTVACENGHINLVKQWIARVKPNKADPILGVILSIACEKGHAKLIDALMTVEGFDINMQFCENSKIKLIADDRWPGAAYLAAQNGHLGVLKKIVKYHGLIDMPVCRPRGENNIVVTPGQIAKHLKRHDIVNYLENEIKISCSIESSDIPEVFIAKFYRGRLIRFQEIKTNQTTPESTQLVNNMSK